VLVTVAHPPVRRLLILAAAAVVVLGVAAVLLWLLSAFAVAHGSSATPDQQAQATVVKSAACTQQDPHDTLRLRVNGQNQQVMLDGCGNPAGQQIAVLVPQPLLPGSLVESASVTSGTPGGSLRRIAFLLLLVSTLVGGGCGYFVYRGRGGPTPAQMLAAPPPARATGPATPPRPRKAAAQASPAAVPPETEPEITGPTTGTNWFEDSAVNLGFDLSDLDEEPDDSRSEDR
jgi:hypothetical protein